jgi:RTX calcium-binding nonapeptide repeat (4 copies)/PASTA domain
VSKSGVLAAVAAGFLAFAASASAAITAEYFFGTLTVESDGGDAMTITCTAGFARVNGAAPAGDQAPCGEVDSIELVGGPDANAINLDAVAPAQFTAVDFVGAFGDDGDDTIAGSAFADDLTGDIGDDVLRGNAGDDELSGGEGSDRLLAGAGDDTLFASAGSDTLDGGEGSDGYSLDLLELGPNVRIGDTGREGTDAVEVLDCEGVTVDAGQITRPGLRVQLSGIELYPCGFTPPATRAPPARRGGAARKNVCVVPRVRGRTLGRARRLILRSGCRVGKITRVPSRLKRGVVVLQRPLPGIRRPRGTKVVLRVSRGP